MFIKSMDELAWKVVITYWSPPSKEDESGKAVPKSELEWSIEEEKQSFNNWKTLNAIFNGVTPTHFKSISAIELAKEAWDILQIEFEGMSVVRKSRIELLTSKFDNL